MTQVLGKPANVLQSRLWFGLTRVPDAEQSESVTLAAVLVGDAFYLRRTN